MIDTLISTIKKQEITLTSWVMGFIGILFVRLLLEGLSSPTLSGIIHTDSYAITHVGLFFLSVTLGTIFIFGYFTKDYVNASKIILFGLPLIWLAPIIDIVISNGKGLKMLYIFSSGKDLILNFLTFFGPNIYSGATLGIRVGIAISILVIGYLIWRESKNIKTSLLSMFFIYLFVFLMATIPGLIYTISHIKNPPAQSIEIVLFLEKIILESTISHNSLREGLGSVTRERFIEIGFAKFVSQILFLISIFISILILWNINKNKFLSVIKNIRLERVNFYTASLFSGIGFAYINGLGNKFVFIDIFGILSITIAWIALWMHAVHLNDINDVDIDKISNKNRPLVKEDLTKKEMLDISNIWLFIGLLGAFLAGFYPFFMALIYFFCSYIYSAPPLRLRRFPLIPSFLISVACLSTILAGFFFVSVYKEIYVFPILLSLGIIIMVTLAINFKDIKDIEGDKQNGIMTIPTMFPKNGIKIVAIMFSLSILLIPLFLSFYLLYIICIPASIIGYRLITKKPYVEKHIFTLRFFLLAGIAISYILIYFMAGVYNLL